MHDKQLLANEATFEPIVQITQNGLLDLVTVFRCVRLSKTRSDLWLFSLAFKLAGLVEIAYGLYRMGAIFAPRLTGL